MGGSPIDARLRLLNERGVVIVDPRQTWVGEDVDLARVRTGATLHPGARLIGPRTFVGSGAQVGAEGPATVVDAVIGPDARVDAGYINGAVLHRGARAGWGAHFRPGTILEEEASTAHCVGLKHSVLLSFVTVGSVVNFCDVLMAGGTSRRDHSEVGSGFIHFNFTPWGERGDKATPSLVGDVVRGVFLRERRIFLGGSSGMVGPRRVGYGAVTAAGQVVRADVDDDRLVLQPPRSLDVQRPTGTAHPVGERLERNLDYIGQLCALRAWYRDVRLVGAADDDTRVVVEAGLENVELCITERVRRLEGFLAERGEPLPELTLKDDEPCPLDVSGSALDHVAWVQRLDDADVARGTAWLRSVAARAVGRAP